MNSSVKTVLLLTALTLLLATAGRFIGGIRGMAIALFFAGVMNFGVYWLSDRLIISLYRAQPLERAGNPALYKIVDELAEAGGLPAPRIYLIPSASPNAFATGRNPRHAVIGVTQGLLECLSDEEIKGVLGHEMAHIRHCDILGVSVVATLAGAVSYVASLARWSVLFSGGRRSAGRSSNPIVLIWMGLLMPLAAGLIQLAVSRTREYEADKDGARLCGNPLYLASALRKLDAGIKKLPMRDARPASAHLFILNPLSGKGIERLFLSHPPIEERMMRLEEMARNQGL